MFEHDGIPGVEPELLSAAALRTAHGVKSALQSGDVATLESLLRAFARRVASTNQPLESLLNGWNALTLDVNAPHILAVQGGAWLALGYNEDHKPETEDPLLAATDTLASRQAELTALLRVSEAANSSLDEAALLATVVDVVAEVMTAEVCSIYLVDPPNTLILAATRGLASSAIGVAKMQIGEGITGWAARERSTLAVADLWQDPRSNYIPETEEDAFHSIVSVPIVNRSISHLLGVLNVQTRVAREFDNPEIDFLEMVSRELALAIENARSYALTGEQLHQKVAELTTLRRVIAMVASSLETQRVLDSIAEGAVMLAEADASAIVVVSQVHGEEVENIAAVYGLTNGHKGTGRAGGGPVGHALESGQPVAVPDIASRRLGPGGDDVALQVGFRSMFLVPFEGRHHTRGALCLYSRDYRNWTRAEVDLVVAFADEAAMALENAALYEDAQRGLATKSALLSELHHRVKNNLQTVASLLSLGMRHATVPEARQVLEESRQRIQSIAVVHDLLSQNTIGLTSVSGVARKVAEIADVLASTPARQIKFTVDDNQISLNTQQATTLAIALNELLTNTIRHAFKGKPKGNVHISQSLSDGVIEVRVEDNGAGLRDGFDLENNMGLGLSIVHSLTSQDLRGGLALERRDVGGTTAILRFPQSRDVQDGTMDVS